MHKMKKRYAISLAIGGVLLICFVAWYFIWPSASPAQLDNEVAKIQVDTVLVVRQSHDDQAEFCAGDCSDISVTADITPVSDYSDLYDRYEQHLVQNGYRLKTTKAVFSNPANADGSPNKQYLTIDAGKRGYQVSIEFNSVENKLNFDRTAPATIPSVDRVWYLLSAHKF